MNITQPLSVLIASIIGATVGIVTLNLQFLNAKKQETQNWYQDKYITNGIDRLISFLLNLKLHFASRANNVSIITEKPLFPTDSILNVETVLNIDDLYILLSFIYLGAREELLADNKDEALQPFDKMADELISILREIRKSMIGFNFRNKKKVYNIYKDRIISTEIKRLNDSISELKSLSLRSAKSEE